METSHSRKPDDQKTDWKAVMADLLLGWSGAWKRLSGALSRAFSAPFLLRREATLSSIALREGFQIRQHPPSLHAILISLVDETGDRLHWRREGAWRLAEYERAGGCRSHTRDGGDREMGC